MFEQQQRERPHHDDAPWAPKQAGPFDGPRTPSVDKPDTAKLLKRMREIDSEQSRKYRQRSGE